MPIDKIILERITSNDPMLTELNLSYHQLTTADFQGLVDALGQNPYLRALDVSGNPINLKCAELLANIPLLTSLVAAHCQINDPIVQALAQNTTMTSMVLAGNNIGAEGAQALARSKILTYLNLTMNQVKDEGAIALASSPALSSLFLGRNQITTKGATALAQNDRLTLLNLDYNLIETEGIAAFAKNSALRSLGVAGNFGGDLGIVLLSNNKMLTSLDASYSNLSDEAAIALAKHPRLTYLNLSFNPIQFKGTNALGKNKILNTLLLNYSRVGDGGAINLACHKTLRKLELTGNQIGFEGAHALAYNSMLTSLTLSSNLIGDAGAITLAHNETLTELLLSYNQIGDSGAIALSENTTLKVLNLNYNNVGKQGKESLAQNKTFSSLIISEEQPPEFTAENLDIIFLLSDSFLCICSLDGIIQFFNPAFPRVLGYNSDELLAKPFLNLLHPDEQKHIKLLSKDDQLINPVLASEGHYRCKDGTYRLIHWNSRMLHQRRYAIGTDVTEKKQFELEFIKEQEKNIWLQLQEAQKFSQKQTEFIAQLSHEVRNPLSGTYGLMEMIKEQVGNIETVLNNPQYMMPLVTKEALIKEANDIKGNIDQVFTCLDYQKTVLDDNLDSVRIMEKKLILKKEPFDLTQVIKEVAHMLQAKAMQKGLSINSKIPDACVVKGDVMRMKQVFVNLISNAIKFTDEGRIDIVFTVLEVTPSSTRTQIEVIDTGIGISSKESSMLFQRFSQGVGSDYGGSGLGLYLIKQLINLMGGDILVDSEKGTGSTFTLMLSFDSLTKEEQQQFQQKEKSVSVSAIETPQFSMPKLHALIVDDNELNRKILGSYLAKVPGYTCEFASNGQEALEAYDKQKFDIIFMDIVMPVMDGIKATLEIRHREQTKQLPHTFIIAVTANVLERDRTEALKAGVDACMVKPIKKEKFFQELAEFMKKKNVEPLQITKKIAFDSPLHNPDKWQELLKNITPGKQWGINVTNSTMWLELESEEEAVKIIDHFKRYDYNEISLIYKENTTFPIPVVLLKELNYEKLKKIFPLSLAEFTSQLKQ